VFRCAHRIAKLFVIALLIVGCRTALCQGGEPSAPLARQTVRVRLTTGQRAIDVASPERITASVAGGKRTLPPGSWTFRAAEATPARQEFRVFVKTFQPAERAAAMGFLDQLQREGYSAEIVTLGRRFHTKSGRIMDTRVLWISAGAFPRLEEAEALRATFEGRDVWGWVRARTVAEGRGIVAVRGNGEEQTAEWEVPLALEADGPIQLCWDDGGAGRKQPQARAYVGRLEIGIAPDGTLEVFETLDVETYLRGVLPSEMPADWPVEALKAQAVAARTDVFAKLGIAHELEGFDLCGAEHCLAYGGQTAWRPRTDAALEVTSGEILTDGERFIPAVFCANCGGWTENNENVWSGPANPNLRGVPDMLLSTEDGSDTPAAVGMAAWLLDPPKAYCSGDPRYYRWRKQFSAEELTAVVNERYPVGPVRSIEFGERGVSGRLKWVTVHGANGAAVIRKELPIRLAFGGLPSAMFLVDVEGGPDRPAQFTFVGGGRGHGVGLCQHGARGMALEGARHGEILIHYFTGARIEKVH